METFSPKRIQLDHKEVRSGFFEQGIEKIRALLLDLLQGTVFFGWENGAKS
jgi:hypothetical protein